MRYFEISLDIPEDAQEIWIAKLYDWDFENFVEENDSLSAFIAEDKWTSELQERLFSELKENKISYNITQHEPQDWNALWESNFDPIIINEHLYVRASFHPQLSQVEHEIIIAPKMAFGTGHHSTTSMILRWMSNQDLTDLDVLDFGCGTGILGIYAKMKNCKSLVMIDHEEAAVENALEHCEINHVIANQILFGSVEQIPTHKFDLILANITRNVLEEHLPTLSEHLNSNGSIIMSGFLESDFEFMKDLVIANNLEFREVLQDKDWIAIHAVKV
ncbi:MAG: 50S ribosomal protein L11 methyltransferase [Saprospiraceae bacterium]